MNTLARRRGIDAKQGIVRKPRSPLQDAWLILLQNKVAVGSGIFLILLLLAAIFAPLITPQGIDEQSLKENYKPSYLLYRIRELLGQAQEPYPEGTRFILGADRFGRDLFTRTIFGARVSLSVAFAGALISLAIGLIYGLISG